MAEAVSASKDARSLMILTAAEGLLRERSIHDITMKEFAEEAGVGVATLFRHFGTKMAILFRIYGDRMDDLIAAIEARDAKADLGCPPQGKTAEHYVNRVLSIYEQRCGFYMESPENFTIYLRSGFDISNENRWRNKGQGDRGVRLILEILSGASERGLIRGGVSLPVVADNCHAIYIHEIDRTPTRELSPSTIWERMRPRLEVQLLPIFL